MKVQRGRGSRRCHKLSDSPTHWIAIAAGHSSLSQVSSPHSVGCRTFAMPATRVPRAQADPRDIFCGSSSLCVHHSDPLSCLTSKDHTCPGGNSILYPKRWPVDVSERRAVCRKLDVLRFRTQIDHTPRISNVIYVSFFVGFGQRCLGVQASGLLLALSVHLSPGAHFPLFLLTLPRQSMHICTFRSAVKRA